MTRIDAVAALMIGGILLFCGLANAFEPSQPECLAPAKNGGGLAISCQLVSKTLEQTHLIDSPMNISFKPGGIGAVAYNHVVGIRNTDSGLIVSASTGSALNLAINKFGRYDIDDVRWLGAIGADYGVVAVRAEAPWHNLKELLSDLAAGEIAPTFGGSGSIGSQDWMKTALLVKQGGIDPRQIHFVAFEGGGEAVNALLNGYIDIFPGDAAELHQHLEAGQVRILAVLADNRLPGPYAGVATAKEQGYPLHWTIWRGYYMGPEVTDEAYNWWLNSLKRLVKTEEFNRERSALGLYPFELFGADFKTFLEESVSEYRQTAREIGLIP